jgi:hypothetical protein
MMNLQESPICLGDSFSAYNPNLAGTRQFNDKYEEIKNDQ